MITFAARAVEPRRAIRHEDIAQRLRQQILSALHLGRLAPSARLPSTRAVAAELGVDPRRVARAYRELVIDGLVDLRPRSGFYVAGNGIGIGIGNGNGNGNGRHPALPTFAQWAIDALVEASELGIRPVGLADELRACLASRQLTAACVECNDDQIHGLAEELKLDYGFATHSVSLDRVDDIAARTALDDVDVLVTTSFHATEVRRLARDLGKPCIAITIRPDLRKWMQDALDHEDVYFVATDHRFAEKAAAMFADLGGSHRIRVLVAGRDDLSAIPASAPTYITRRAREVLGDHPISSRVINLPRLFARESRQAVLTFIIEANARRVEDVRSAVSG